MLTRLKHAQTTVARSLCRYASSTPASASNRPSPKVLKANTPLAKQVKKLGIWEGRKKAKGPKSTEYPRVQLVSEKLCDDTLEYLGSSLDRHKGCDLLDLNPGSGLWSRKLHDLLEPRKHILMDSDIERFTPFLKELMAKDTVTVLPQSGLVWKSLLEALDTHLSHHPIIDRTATPERNDTLLVTANLAMFPKQKFGGFESIATMVLYQFISTIATQALFHRYGLVRMLVWVHDDDCQRILPHNVARRRRVSFDTELSCEWVHQVVGFDLDPPVRSVLRDDWIDLESGYNTLARMRAAGRAMPKGRETKLMKRLLADEGLMGQKLAGVHPPKFARPFLGQLKEKEQQWAESDESDAAMRRTLALLRVREKTANEDGPAFLEVLQDLERIKELHNGPPEELAAAQQALTSRLDGMTKNRRSAANLARDNLHVFRQPQPVLHWDRREYEPLVAKPDDFYPNVPVALLDLQPKAMHPLFRQCGPGTSRAGDMSEELLRQWFQSTLHEVHAAMGIMWAGFGDMHAACPSLRDPARGGWPGVDGAALTVRAMNEAQWTEIVQAWMDWPFKPDYVDFLAKHSDESMDGDDDDIGAVFSGAMGPGGIAG
ncbi:hypothetical protein S7711_03133 [Stachybotrys chartarum IBT 7711]|uniref:Mitochondrial transcription factor 1 n=1 Tax=Stachybotrys chartarum (strain CBS 109288 / IBT 7711) TaxID=1280523 RepID=A0A084B8F9_STACB|nr:hypothetical protein S7711_03133 [Stachybotrys chartarum IBT 7711]KFA55366.1 hypothetical protein S40293_05719 [Stachybotrys chartarum IBT 40293]